MPKDGRRDRGCSRRERVDHMDYNDYIKHKTYKEDKKSVSNVQKELERYHKLLKELIQKEEKASQATVKANIREKEKVLPSLQRIHEESSMNGDVVIKRDQCTFIEEDENERENTFHTRCKLKSELCSLMIDQNFYTNLASAFLVEKLGLPTLEHPKPYKLQSTKGCLEVKEQVLLAIFLGRYEDEILCYVSPMSITHILFGKSWQDKKETTYDKHKNRYSLVNNSKKLNLASLSPKEAHNHQIILEKKEREMREERVAKTKEKGENESRAKK